jgi:uncharacterized membrane protein
MRRTSKLILTLTTIVVVLSFVGNIVGYANGEQDGYETVGGEVAPISFITTFLVPALVIIAIFAALVILGVIRIRFESDANEST